jgi:hypothetical protein
MKSSHHWRDDNNPEFLQNRKNGSRAVIVMHGQSQGEVPRKLTESDGQGIGKTDNDRGIALMEDNGIGTISADIDDDNGAFLGSQLKRSERHSL